MTTAGQALAARSVIRDRRSGHDRRAFARFAAHFDLEWESLTGKQPGTISDISATGCFILCSGAVEDGENVRIFLPTERGNIAVVWGEVVNHVEEIGFAMRFIEIGNNERLALERLLYFLSQNQK